MRFLRGAAVVSVLLVFAGAGACPAAAQAQVCVEDDTGIETCVTVDTGGPDGDDPGSWDPGPWVPEYNEYTTDLPAYVTEPTPFTVTVTGPDPVCSMTFRGATDTAAPWEFSWDPDVDTYDQEVLVGLCDGTVDSTYAWTDPAFEAGNTWLMAGSGREKVTVSNATPVDATATLMTGDGARVAGPVTVPATGRAAVEVNTSRVKRTVTYRLVVAGGQYRDTFDVLVSHGFSSIMGSGFGDTALPYEQCQRVTWSYDPRKQRSGVTTGALVKDIAAALQKIEARTNLTFVRHTGEDPAKARLRFAWKNMGGSWPSATGSTTGDVLLNTKDTWILDRNRGFGPSPTALAGRAVLIVHETMHTMGFGHVDDPDSIMASVNMGARTFSRGDLDGLAALYPKGRCGG